MNIKSIAFSLSMILFGSSLMAKNYYEVLGVPTHATHDEIRAAYKKRAKFYHPDKQAGKTDEEKTEAERMFKLINEAHEKLGDDKSKKQYDSEQGTTFNAHAAQHTELEDQVMFMAGIVGANKTLSYLNHAWDQYTIKNNLAKIKKHVGLQLKNAKENKRIAPIRGSLDLNWLADLRKGNTISPIEQLINQFDGIVKQNPKALPTVCPQMVELMNDYAHKIGNASTSLFKAVALVAAGFVGYQTSGQWLSQLVSSKLFRFGLYFFTK